MITLALLRQRIDGDRYQDKTIMDCLLYDAVLINGAITLFFTAYVYHGFWECVMGTLSAYIIHAIVQSIKKPVINGMMYAK